MSDLQFSLLGLGIAGIGAVWVYNKLQERKHRQAAEKIFRNGKADVLLDEEAPAAADTPIVEPAVAMPATGASPAEPRYEPVFDDRREPTFDDTPPAAPEPEPQVIPSPATVPPAAPALRTAKIPPADWCNPNTDVVARLSFEAPLAAADLWQAQMPVQAAQRLPLRWFAQTAEGEWLMLPPDDVDSYAAYQVAMQLVDRHGPVVGTELEALRDGLDAIVTSFGGGMEFPDIPDLTIQAKALDEFCAQLDLQLAMHVVDAGTGAFAGTKLRGVAEAAGLRLTDVGEFYAFDENEHFLFSLSNMGGEAFDMQNLRNMQIHGLTFVLDVPHVAEGLYAFERMLSVARQFSTALGGALVNAQRSPLSEPMLNAIRQKIGEIHDQMMLAGLPAGGACARRLFS